MKILYGKLNINSITGNQLLWKNVCALFSNKTLSKISKTTLLKKGEIVTDDTKLLFSATESKHFLKKTEGITCNTGNEKDAIFRTIKKYSLHSSIVRTKKKKFERTFSRKCIQRTYGESKKDLDSKKCSHQNNIPVKVLKLNAVIVSSFISKIFNESIENFKFQDSLKLTDINPVYKNNNLNNKAYYKSVSILLAFSKIFEMCLHDQI